MAKRTSKRERLTAEQGPEGAYEWYRHKPIWTNSRGWWAWGLRKDHKHGYDVYADTEEEALQRARNSETALGGL